MSPVAGQIIRATDIANLIVPQFVIASAATTFVTGTGNVRQDIAGLTFDVTTVNPDAEVLVQWFVDCIVNTAVVGNFQARLEIDGVPESPLAIWPTNTVNVRGTAGQQMQKSHPTPGTYTYKITGACSSATGGATINTNGTTLSALVVDQA